MDVFAIHAHAYEPDKPNTVKGTKGFICDSSDVSDSTDFIIRVNQTAPSIVDGTIVFVSRRRAQEVRDEIDRRWCRNIDQDNLRATFVIQPVRISSEDFRRFQNKGFLFKKGTV